MRFAFPQLLVAIFVGGLTTFVLVMIFTRPVIRLRKAAREMAQGKLGTRVKEAKRGAVLKGDEFEALAHDFNHMAERLEWLVNAQKLLLRDVSHELRSPLARLSVALELSREDADATMSTHLNRIQRETERLNQLIGQLLTLSSMEAVEDFHRFEKMALKELLAEMLPDAEYEAQQRDASVILHADCDCVVEGQRELVYRALENVIRNAIRYTEAGTEVEITLKRDAAGRMAHVEVSDRGPGIPEAELESIFRPFYRVDAARSAQTGGFGVGLAIAERAVKLHNGQIRAENRAGGGTTIRISLPLAV
jgi:two-component system sensor histidine kinase CpxA